MYEYYQIDGIVAGQHSRIDYPFKKILYDFDRIIEIGTHRGGLTLFLHKNKLDICELISYDIEASYNEVPKNYNIDFRIGDCFSSKTINEIKNLIEESDKKVLLLCDGGDKNKEFNIFSEFIKEENDVIMLHDYAESIPEFRSYANAIGWGDPGSFYSNILPSIEKNKLSKYKHYDLFKAFFWGAFYKPKLIKS